MKKNRSRTENATINIIIGIIYQVIVVVTGFIARKIFVVTLDVNYLGVNGILNNIISVLSLSELGISSAIIYSLYKPIVEDNKEKISALIQYYHKLYNIIALIITIIGLLLLPFLQYIIKLDLPMNEIIIYYLLFLFNTVVSYLFTYKTAILIANQQEYECKKYMLFTNITQFIFQIVVLVIFHNFFLYLCVQIICSILSNYLCSRKAEKLYPYINDKKSLKRREKKLIWNNIKSMFAYKIGGVILNNTDNILISIILGTVVVGYYSNYSMILTQVSTICGIIFTAMQASLGNLAVEESAEKKYFIFRVLQLMSHWIYGFCSICFIVLFQDFITLWLGKEFVLSNGVVIVCALNFYVQGMLYPILCYRNTTGLFKNTKYTMFIASIINLVLSIIGGYIWGLVGILGATAVSRLTTNSWYEPFILFKKYFKTKPWKYYKTEIIRLILNMIIMIITVLITNLFVNDVSVWTFVIKCIICLVIPNILYFIIFRKKEEFIYLKDGVLRGITTKLKNRKQ